MSVFKIFASYFIYTTQRLACLNVLQLPIWQYTIHVTSLFERFTTANWTVHNSGKKIQ